ncbi:NADPH oxidase 4, partial [Fragariocoptes setiger]
VIAWLVMNCIIFSASYFNYQIQLKHRYLYRMLSIGLCTSRAAAMVINVNLLLVWLPMCKYCLTNIVSVWFNRKSGARNNIGNGNNVSNTTKDIAQSETRPIEGQRHHGQQQQQQYHCYNATTIASIDGAMTTTRKTTSAYASDIGRRYDLKMFDNRHQHHQQFLAYIMNASGNNNSVIMAHKRRAWNDLARFREKFAPIVTQFVALLTRSLKNAVHTFADHSRTVHTVCAITISVASVPGITGALMLMILALMSLSSIGSIRNSSYDLFHLLHRLSIVFVILLYLHPSSRILKEQSNVDRHHPDHCLNVTRQISPNYDLNHHINNTATATNSTRTIDNDKSGNLCLDALPQFVAQRSVSWILLSIGLVCYLLDSLIRRYHRIKNSIELLDVHFDSCGQLIELVMSSNHKRFNNWLPGQFVYLNCPLIERNEWHPFTISSMDEMRAQFTLHIKTSGDWTQKLRSHLHDAYSNRQRNNNNGDNNKLLSSASSKPLSCSFERLVADHSLMWLLPKKFSSEHSKLDNLFDIPEVGANSKHQPVECIKYVKLMTAHDDKIVCCKQQKDCQEKDEQVPIKKKIEIFIDGPFHSPFERIMSKSISICIANGVGWTAFSSIFTHTMDVPFPSQSLASGKCNIHLVIVVANFEQLRPLYLLLDQYFDSHKAGTSRCTVREISAYITRESINNVLPAMRATRKHNRYQHQDHNNGLMPTMTSNGDIAMIQVNPSFTILFGRPQFELYFHHIVRLYTERKASVFCCGSRPVRSQIKRLCKEFNQRMPINLSYHEE